MTTPPVSHADCLGFRLDISKALVPLWGFFDNTARRALYGAAFFLIVSTLSEIALEFSKDPPFTKTIVDFNRSIGLILFVIAIFNLFTATYLNEAARKLLGLHWEPEPDLYDYVPARQGTRRWMLRR